MRRHVMRIARSGAGVARKQSLGSATEVLVPIVWPVRAAPQRQTDPGDAGSRLEPAVRLCDATVSLVLQQASASHSDRRRALWKRARLKQMSSPVRVES